MTCHQGSCCLLGVSQPGLLTCSTFNITDWFVQGVTIDSNIAQWKAVSLHICFFCSLRLCFSCFQSSSSCYRSQCYRFLLVLKISVKSSGRKTADRGWRPLLSFIWLSSVGVLSPPTVKVMTRMWQTSSLHWISSHSERTMLRGLQATWTLMTQGPSVVNGDRGSVTIERGQGALFNAIDYLSWPSLLKRRDSKREKEMFPEQQNTSVSIFYPQLLPSALPPQFTLSSSLDVSPSPLPNVAFKARPRVIPITKANRKKKR